MSRLGGLALVLLAAAAGRGESWGDVDESAGPSGRSTVRIPSAAQKAGGIETRALEPARGEPEIAVYGTVVNIQPLIDLRTRYLAARADADGIRASLKASRAEYQRLSALNRDDRNVSDRAAQVAEAAWRSDAARLAAALRGAAGIAETLRNNWGPVVAGWAADPGSTIFAGLLRHDEALVQMALPFDAPAPGNPILAPAAAPGRGRPARLVSPSPQTDPALSGRTYFYRAKADDLRHGMRVVGKLPGVARAGVIVPASAVVWHAGKPWVYVRRDGDFERQSVELGQETSGGWFSAASLKPGEQVVVRGAQLLLSEEFKAQIRNENED